MNSSEKALLEVKSLEMHFPVKSGSLFPKTVGLIKAVDGISFRIAPGRTLGLVGESGCGKSTAARAILQLYKPTGGEVLFEGIDLCKLKAHELRPIRKSIQMVFQDPYSSLNPRMTAGQILAEPLTVHHLMKGAQKKERVSQLLEQVGLSPTAVARYPHEFSGGQRQRIGIARALATGPKIILCDEPVSSLDVSVRAQIINLLQELQEKLQLSYLFISHELAIVRHISHEVAVMYLGKIVEFANTKELYSNPLHPYTKMLLAAAPVPDPKVEANKKYQAPIGETPSPEKPPLGCPFHPRCPEAKEECKTVPPQFKKVSDRQSEHWVACHLYNEGNS